MDIIIKLNDIQVNGLDFRVNGLLGKKIGKLEVALGYKEGFSEESDTFFGLEFTIVIENAEKTFFLELNATAHFESNESIDESFKKSSFVLISAPAIAFPFLRTLIANFTLNAGYEAIMLPSYNFVKLAENRSREEKNSKDKDELVIE